jgi:hypothetical protein
VSRTISAPVTTVKSATSISASTGAPVVGSVDGGPLTPGWVTAGGSEPMVSVTET